jgi:Tat protein secretion system quality control protein TatD with DNase activity
MASRQAPAFIKGLKKVKRLIFDSHAHYDDEAFAPDRDELLQSLPGRGVCNIISMGADFDGCRGALQLAQRYSYLYAGVGIHPENAANLPADYLGQIERWSHEPKVVAIGEIGLDYHYRIWPRVRCRSRCSKIRFCWHSGAGCPLWCMTVKRTAT